MSRSSGMRRALPQVSPKRATCVPQINEARGFGQASVGADEPQAGPKIRLAFLLELSNARSDMLNTPSLSKPQRTPYSFVKRPPGKGREPFGRRQPVFDIADPMEITLVGTEAHQWNPAQNIATSRRKRYLVLANLVKSSQRPARAEIYKEPMGSFLLEQLLHPGWSLRKKSIV